jgi:2-C-methyl-D-erythritol 4-phosphate cytidylyltransferase
VGVVIPAAGSGVRFGGPKAFVELAGRPLLLHSLLAFAAVDEVLEIAVAATAADLERARDLIARSAGEIRAAAAGRDPPGVVAVPGGARRQDSVAAGIRALSPAVRSILVHDAARPLVLTSDIRKMVAAIREGGAAVLGHPATDSVKEEGGGVVARELPRERIWLVQTPQGARVDLLRRAFEEGERAGIDVTDEVGLLFAAGIPVRLVEGSRTNLKITFPEDLSLGEFLLGKFSEPCP